ncbi:acid-sensing ion channel 2 isoform X1 [Corythoichthys intestinalis]|uniref:acid-sensing ion channel 2 isoform X1 n=1 Tax=Corythoichthys intestinalis TaxID=161448 RepID=UPI0025A60E5C|nr:acid-sensing ion channel 2 isoform X1 [Corythoichthys intestinalis]XP_061804976.1 acid-sensing ion channel 2-like isoform X1 [Nerophis lumbriciformis]
MWAAAPQAGLGNDAVPVVVRALWAAVMARERRSLRSPEATRRRGTPRAFTFALLSRTRLHGLRQVCVPGGSLGRRVFWLLALCTSLGMLLSWSSNRLLHWMSFPTYTRVHTEWAKELDFPVVTICNNNPIRLYKLTKSDLYFAGHWLGLLLANRTVRPLVLDLLQEDRVGWFGKLSDFKLFLPPRNFEGTNLEFMDRLSHQLDDMLLSCKYRGEPCGAHNFSSVFTRYGKCYMFNAAEEGKSLRTTMKGGTGNGLEIMLDIQQDEYLPVWGDTEDTAFEAGVRVQIHSQAEPPFVHELGFGVAPGFQTFVATQEQRLTFLPPPWGECESKALESGFFQVYSVTACRIDCETRYIVENCNCRMVHMPGDAPYCTPEQYKDCAEPALAKLSAAESSGCMCRTPCNVTRYNKELSMVKIPSKTSARYLQKKFNKSEKYIADNILVLDVFFEALNYETIEQKKAYEVAGLLGDIGGQMGLFIGASILTILELFDYAYEVVRDRLLDLLSREDEEEGRRADVTSCDPVANHSESISHSVAVPLQATLEEIAC